MGRLPHQYASKPVTFRSPYVLSGEIDIGPNQKGLQFDDDAFSNQVDKPFEIHRMMVRLSALGTVRYTGQPGPVSQVLEPQPETMGKRIRLRVEDFGKNQMFTKRVTLVDSLQTANRQTWDWEDPYTIVRSEGLRVSVDSDAFPSVCAVLEGGDCTAPSIVAVEQCRVEVSFEGFLLVVAAPTETR